jgi:hypothetical protein
MMTDWDSEWPRLCAAEQDAFEAHMDAQAKLTAHRLHQPDPALRMPDLALEREAADAERVWRDAEAACDRFLTTYRRAA